MQCCLRISSSIVVDDAVATTGEVSVQRMIPLSACSTASTYMQQLQSHNTQHSNSKYLQLLLLCTYPLLVLDICNACLWYSFHKQSCLAFYC
jgi:hypothetical protein